MNKKNSQADCYDIHSKIISKGKILFALLVAMILTNLPVIHAAEILVGTPTNIGGIIIFKADVLPGQTYSNVFGLTGNNTDSNCYAEVNINEGTVSGAIYGNRAISGAEVSRSSLNTVNFINSTAGTVYGGYAYGGSNNATVHQNSVNITGGSVSMFVYGGNADGSTISVTGNRVNIKNALIEKAVYGGCAFNTSSWLSMLRNTVEIENSTVNGSIYGGYASGSNTAANNNTVTINGNSIINGSICGGYALSANSDSKNNTVIILNGTLKNRIYGGIGRNATGNTIVLKGGNLTKSELYGYSDGRKSHSGNTLEIWTPEITVKSAQNFERFMFVVPEDVLNTDTFMLKTLSPINLSGTTVGVAVENGTVVSIGDSIKLIDNVVDTATVESLVGKELKGGTLFLPCDFLLTVEDNALVATIKEAYSQNERPFGEPLGGVISKNIGLVVGQIASVDLLSEGNDLALNIAMSDAETAADMAQVGGESFSAFITTGGGKSDYYTGNHINMLSNNLVAGVSRKLSNFKTDDALLGLYFETGNSDYSTFNSTDEGSVFGEGSSQYCGGGLMFQMKMLENRALCLQTISRLGSLDNDWDSDDFSEKVVCNTNHVFMGSSFGVVYQGEIGNGFGYDVCGKVMWTHQNGTSADINGEKLEFNSIDQIKTRLGSTMAYSNEKIKAFLSVAWERQFNENATATINGVYPLETQAFVGNIGLLEFGTSFTLHDNWQFDLVATDYFGVRKGFKGSAFLSFDFQ